MFSYEQNKHEKNHLITQYCIRCFGSCGSKFSNQRIPAALSNGMCDRLFPRTDALANLSFFVVIFEKKEFVNHWPRNLNLNLNQEEKTCSYTNVDRRAFIRTLLRTNRLLKRTHSNILCVQLDDDVTVARRLGGCSCRTAKSEHQRMPQIMEPRTYPCDRCKVVFDKLSLLKFHLHQLGIGAVYDFKNYLESRN